MPPSPDATLLNEPQRRHLGIVLGQTQRLLHDIVIRTGGGAPRGGLVAEADDLPPAFVRGAGDIITRVDAEIATLTVRFNLPQREQSRCRWARAVLSASIDDLEDTRAARLGAYGAVQPGLAGALDPALKHLQRELRALADPAHQHHRLLPAGLSAALPLETTAISPEVRAMLTIGFCGGYTTFSTFRSRRCGCWRRLAAGGALHHAERDAHGRGGGAGDRGGAGADRAETTVASGRSHARTGR